MLIVPPKHKSRNLFPASISVKLVEDSKGVLEERLKTLDNSKSKADSRERITKINQLEFVTSAESNGLYDVRASPNFSLKSVDRPQMRYFLKLCTRDCLYRMKELGAVCS